MGTIYRDLTPIKEVIEDLGFNLSYPYDDLLFIESNAFLIQYDDKSSNTFYVYFNKEMKEDDANFLQQRIIRSAAKNKLIISPKGRFELAPKKGSEEEIEIRFS